MRRSQNFIKTRRDAPADETAKNAQLLIRAGYIYKDSAGVYALLPLGLRVVENIKKIIREEMNGLGGAELLMTSLQRREVWEQTDRWDDEKVDVWFKSKLKNGTEVGLGWSHEEQITTMMKDFISSYRDMPASVYQFQNKLRNELRAKSGIMRAREFLMKDMYSYSRNEDEHKAFYDKVTEAYLRVYEKVGLGDDTFLTFASGGAFTQFSHEFQTVTDAGEDIIYLHRNKKIAINQEVMTDEVMQQLGVSRDELEEVKA
ncbi:MAG: prolyl-tRNA synthetase, partial [Candidatus Saccharibacteria bacterium]|nr:prolyl-tRNA synthetase [Candidatus Saccharibacteria bacterium]